MVDYAASFRARLPDTPWFTGQTRLVEKLSTYLPDEDVELVVRAYAFGAAAHEGQRRRSGEPYISHPVAVADILADMRMDGEAIAAAILHDVIEDTPAVKGELAEQFGDDVAALVDGVTKLDQVKFRSRAEAQAESFRKMLLAMVEDIRVILVKLADRLHNMRTLHSMPPEKQRRIAGETLEIYAPIANRLGIHTIKSELEELGFRYVYPHRYKVLDKAVRRAFGNQRQMLKKISLAFLNGRKDERASKAYPAGSSAGRRPPTASTCKMLAQEDLSLLRGDGRLCLPHHRATRSSPTVTWHARAPPTRSTSRRPRSLQGLHRPAASANGYQSLHTTCSRAAYSLPVEIQIRTRGNGHRRQRQGAAAHWQLQGKWRGHGRDGRRCKRT